MNAPETLTDAELVERCRSDDAAAWAGLVERYARYVYAIIQAFRLRDHDSEDVFQDVFARAYEKLGGLRDGGAVRPWLAQLTRNACIDNMRARSREETTAEDLDVPQLDETLQRLDDALAVRAALERLSGDCREVLDRFFARDESYRTIGAALGLAAGTIASRISRCLDKLRDEFSGRKPKPARSG